jgi:phosphonate transport system permease protein
VSTPSIDDRLAVIERSQRVRQLLAVAFLALVVAATYLGLQFIQFEWRSIQVQLGTQANFILEFFPVDFVDFTNYSADNEIRYFEAVLSSFSDGGAPFLDALLTDELTLVRGSFTTLLLGFLGTVLGFPLALIFGVLGSERVTPFPFNFVFRGTMSAIRAIPAIIWVFIYAPLVGINPSGAVLAIGTDTIGNLGRLFTDELEEIDEGPIEAIRSTGASRGQVIGFGMLSQVFRSFIAWTLYILEINVRIAIGLGVIGAGGIGFYITSRQDLFAYQRMAAGIVMVFVIVVSVELISSRLRARLRPEEEGSGGRGLMDIVRGLGNPGKWFGFGVGKRGNGKE